MNQNVNEFKGFFLYLFDAVSILLHGNFLHCALETEEGFDVQAGRLFETCPVLVLGVNLTSEKHAQISKYRELDTINQSTN